MPIIGVGHSLGGATAELVREAMVFKDRSLAEGNYLVTFGKPRTGTAAAVASYTQPASSTRHYFHDTDMVAHVPPRTAPGSSITVALFAESPNKFLLREPLAKVDLKDLPGADELTESGRQEMTAFESAFYEAFGTAFEIRRAIRTAVGNRSHYMASYAATVEKIGRERFAEDLPVLAEVTAVVEAKREAARLSRLAQEQNARADGARRFGAECIDHVRRAAWTGVWRPLTDCSRCCQATYARSDGGYAFCSEEWRVCVLA